MWENKNFQNIIQSEKENRLPNLNQISEKATLPNIKIFFEWKNIDEKEIYNFLKKLWKSKSSIECDIPLLKLNKWKKQIIKEIKTFWSFKNPEDLAEKIATLIKENCEYSKLKNNISNFEYKNQELLIQIEKLLAWEN